VGRLAREGAPRARARAGAGRPRTARAEDREAGAEGDTHPARLPRRRRTRLPHRRPLGDDALRRRGAAHPARDADRLRAHGMPVHPRRAVHRAPSARQRAPHPDAPRHARPREHDHRRRARRGDDPHGGLGDRHRARRRRARRRGGRRGDRGGHHPAAALDHRRIPFRPPSHTVAVAAAQAESGGPRRARRARAQPQGHRRPDPARALHRDHRRVGLGEEHARERDPLPAPRAGAHAREGAAGRARPRRGDPAFSRRSASSSRRCPRRACVATPRDGSRST